jgi:predicted PurR-regulated permease PerM
MTAPRTPLPRSAVWEDGLGRTAIRSLQVLLVLTLVVVLTYAAVRLRLLVIPLLIAALVAAAASPVVDWLHRRRVPRSVATLLTILAGFGILGGLGWWIGAAVAGQWDDLRSSAVEGFDQLRSYLIQGPLPINGEDLSGLQDKVRSGLTGTQAKDSAISGAYALVEFLTGLFLGIVLLFFLLRDGRDIWRFARGFLPERQRDTWNEAAQRSAYVLGRYVRGTAVVATVDSVVIGLGLIVMGVPLALPLAVAVFLGAFIPLVGATAAGILATLVALVSQGPITALLVAGLVILVNQLEGDLLYPIVMGQALALHPLAILLALTAGTIVAGVVGAILAVPFAAVAWGVLCTFRDAPADPAPGHRYAGGPSGD